jgi:hypothetical protein
MRDKERDLPTLLEFEVFYREVAAISWFQKLLGF